MLQNFAGVSKANGVPSNNVVEYKIGDILISNIRPYLKKIWLANQNGGCSSDIIVLSPCENYDGSFVYYLLANDGFVSYVMSGAKGLKMPRGDKQQILKYGISIPSLKEQRKIAALLDLFDQHIETQKKIIEDLKKLKAAICIFKLKSHCEKEYAIRELCQSITAKQYIANEITSEGAYPIIQQGENSIAGYTDSLPFLNYKKVILLGDHTLSIYRPETPFLIATDGIKILKPNEMVIRDYFYYLLYTFMPEPEGYKRHYSILKDIIVPIPNIKMQESIVDKLLSIDSKLEIEERILELQIQQKQYLLNRLFI